MLMLCIFLACYRVYDKNVKNGKERSIVIYETQQNLEDYFWAAAIEGDLRVLRSELVDNLPDKDSRFTSMAVAIVGKVNGYQPYDPIKIVERLRDSNPEIKIVNATGDDLEGANFVVDRIQMNFPALVKFLSDL